MVFLTIYIYFSGLSLQNCLLKIFDIAQTTGIS